MINAIGVTLQGEMHLACASIKYPEETVSTCRHDHAVLKQTALHTINYTMIPVKTCSERNYFPALFIRPHTLGHTLTANTASAKSFKYVF